MDALALGTTLAQCGLAIALLSDTRQGEQVSWIATGARCVHGVSVGIPLIADPFSAALALLVPVLASCALLYSWHYFAQLRGRFHALILLVVAGMEGFVLSGNVFDMFVFFELMGVVAYALTGLKIEDSTAVWGALNFGVTNSFGALSLTGIVIQPIRKRAIRTNAATHPRSHAHPTP